MKKFVFFVMLALLLRSFTVGIEKTADTVSKISTEIGSGFSCDHSGEGDLFPELSDSPYERGICESANGAYILGNCFIKNPGYVFPCRLGIVGY